VCGGSGWPAGRIGKARPAPLKAERDGSPEAGFAGAGLGGLKRTAEP